MDCVLRSVGKGLIKVIWYRFVVEERKKKIEG
jgi:hypothetical protein